MDKKTIFKKIIISLVFAAAFVVFFPLNKSFFAFEIPADQLYFTPTCTYDDPTIIGDEYNKKIPIYYRKNGASNQALLKYIIVDNEGKWKDRHGNDITAPVDFLCETETIYLLYGEKLYVFNDRDYLNDVWDGYDLKIYSIRFSTGDDPNSRIGIYGKISSIAGTAADANTKKNAFSYLFGAVPGSSYVTYKTNSYFSCGPELDYETVPDGAYRGMFMCSTIVEPPIVDAVYVGKESFRDTFYACKQMETLPAFDFATLDEGSLHDTFYIDYSSAGGKIDISETSSTEYCIPWRLPSTRASLDDTADPNTINQMFNYPYNPLSFDIQKETTYYLKANAASCLSVVKKTIDYDGSSHELIFAPIQMVGATKIEYALGSNNTTAPTDSGVWSESVPTASDVGHYYIWYRLVPDSYHYAPDPACVESEILDLPTVSNLAMVSNTTRPYLASAWTMTTTPTVTGGTIRFGFGNSETSAPSSASWAWDTNIPKKTDAGVYYVWYKVDPNTGYRSIGPTYLGKFEITKANFSVSLSRIRFEHTGSEIKPDVVVNAVDSFILGTDYTVSYSNNVDIGEGVATVTVLSTPKFNNYNYDNVTTLRFNIYGFIPDDQIYFTPSSSEPSKVYWLKGANTVAEFEYVIVDIDGNYIDKNGDSTTVKMEFPDGIDNGITINPGEKLYVFHKYFYGGGDGKINNDSLNRTVEVNFTRFRCDHDTAVFGNLSSLSFMENSNFDYLFGGESSTNVNFTHAPNIDFDILYSYSIANMFKNSKIVEPPLFVYPFNSIYANCMYETFNGCTELITLPSISIKGFADSDSLQRLFLNCSKIKVSTTSDANYCIPWKLPANDDHPSLPDLYHANYPGSVPILSSTSGTFTGNPVADTTYYLWKYSASCSAVVPNTIVFDDNPHDLVIAPAQLNGATKIEYGIGTSATVGPTSWSTTIPQETNAGDYYVWYRLTPDSNHAAVDPAYVVAHINKSEPTFDKTVNTDFTYDGTSHTMVTVNQIVGGTVYYLFGTDSTTAPSSSDSGWSTTIPSKINAGTYYIWYKIEPDFGFETVEPSYIGSESVIKKADLTAALDPTSYEYTGSAINPTATFTGFVSPDSFTSADYTVTCSNNINVGTASGIISLNDTTTAKNYNLTTTSALEFAITKKSIKPHLNTSDQSITFDGNEHDIDVGSWEGLVSGQTLAKGIDYNISHSPDATNVGAKTSTVTLIESSNKAKNYKIEDADKTLSWSIIGLVTPSFSPSLDLKYTAEAKQPGIIWTDSLGNTISLNNSDYSVSYDNNINAGVDTATATVTLNNTDYSLTDNPTVLYFSIGKATLSFALDNNSYEYDGSEKEPTVTLAGTQGSDSLTLDTDYSVSYSDNKNVGPATVAVALKSTNLANNYELSTSSVNFDINKKTITPVLESGSPYTYTGNPIKPNIASWNGTVGSEVLTLSTDYTVEHPSDTEATNVGTKTVKVSLVDTGTVAKNYKLPNDPYELTYEIIGDDPTVVLTPINVEYDGSAHTLATLTTNVGTSLIEYGLGTSATVGPTDWSTSIPEKTDVGTYYLWFKATGDSNHNNIAAKYIESEAKITKKTIFPVLEQTSYPYDGLPHKPDVSSWTVPGVSLTKGESNDYTIVWPDDATSAGDKNVTITLMNNGPVSKNYQLATNPTILTYTIGKVDPTVTGLQVKNALIYNGQELELTTTPTVVGGTIEYSIGTSSTAGSSWSTSIPKEKNVGDYYIWYKVTGDASHNDIGATPVSGVAKILPATITPHITATHEYDAQAYKPTVDSWDGLVPSEALTINTDYEIAYDGDLTNVGTNDKTAKITLKANGTNSKNYVLDHTPYEIQYSITKKELTPSLEYSSHAYTGDELKPTISFNGFAGSDSFSFGPTDYTATYSNNINAGTASVTITLSSDLTSIARNYSLSTNSLTFTIDELVPTISISDQTISCTISPSAQIKSFTAATVSAPAGSSIAPNASLVQYSIESQPSGNYFSIPGSSQVRIAANTPINTYSLSMKATYPGETGKFGPVSQTFTITINVTDKNPNDLAVSSTTHDMYVGEMFDLSSLITNNGQGALTYTITQNVQNGEPGSLIGSNYTAGLGVAGQDDDRTVKITIKAAGNASYNEGSHEITITIKKKEPSYSGGASSQTKTVRYYGPQSSSYHTTITDMLYPSWSEGAFEYNITSPTGNDFDIDHNSGVIKIKDGIAASNTPYTITINAKTSSTAKYKATDNNITLTLKIEKSSLNINAPYSQIVIRGSGQSTDLIPGDVTVSTDDGNNPLGYVVQYAVGTSETVAPTSGWTTSKPSGSELKDYYIWYQYILYNPDKDNYTPASETPIYLGKVRLVKNQEEEDTPSTPNNKPKKEDIQYIYLDDPTDTNSQTPIEDNTNKIENNTIDVEPNTSTVNGNPFLGVGGVFSFILLLLILLLLLLILFLKRRKEQEEDQEELYYY